MSSSGEQDDDDDQPRTKLDPILDEDEPEGETEASASVPPSHTTATPPLTQGQLVRDGSETPSHEGTNRSSPSSAAASSGFAIIPYDPHDFHPADEKPDWSDLPLDYQRHLNWFDENMTHYHYGLPLDTDDFFKGILPQAARRSEPLLNALTAFAAYHQTIQNPDGKLSDFLGYYNRSIKLLLEALQTKQKHNVTTLMTILQIAQIEVIWESRL